MKTALFVPAICRQGFQKAETPHTSPERWAVFLAEWLFSFRSLKFPQNSDPQFSQQIQKEQNRGSGSDKTINMLQGTLSSRLQIYAETLTSIFLRKVRAPKLGSTSLPWINTCKLFLQLRKQKSPKLISILEIFARSPWTWQMKSWKSHRFEQHSVEAALQNLFWQFPVCWVINQCAACAHSKHAEKSSFRTLQNCFGFFDPRDICFVDRRR